MSLIWGKVLGIFVNFWYLITSVFKLMSVYSYSAWNRISRNVKTYGNWHTSITHPALTTANVEKWKRIFTRLRDEMCFLRYALHSLLLPPHQLLLFFIILHITPSAFSPQHTEVLHTLYDSLQEKIGSQNEPPAIPPNLDYLESPLMSVPTPAPLQWIRTGASAVSFKSQRWSMCAESANGTVFVHRDDSCVVVHALSMRTQNGSLWLSLFWKIFFN